jgi:hypothetical protein
MRRTFPAEEAPRMRAGSIIGSVIGKRHKIILDIIGLTNLPSAALQK